VDFGPVNLEKKDKKRVSLAGGAAVLRVARIEPLVNANEIWATEDFKQVLEAGPTLYQAVALRPGGEDSTRGDAQFNIKKPGSAEDDSWIKLYRIAPRSG
jgi:hypothetical protein